MTTVATDKTGPHAPTSHAIDALPDNDAEGGGSNTPRNPLDATVSAKPDALHVAGTAVAGQGLLTASKLFTLPNPAWVAQDEPGEAQATSHQSVGDGGAAATHPASAQLSPSSSAGGRTPGSALRHMPALQDEARLLEDVSAESLRQIHAHLQSLLQIVASAIASRQTARAIDYEDEQANGEQGAALALPATATNDGADRHQAMGAVQMHSLLYLMPFQEQVRAAENFACRLAGEAYCFSSGPELRKASRLCTIHDEDAERFVDHAMNELRALTEPDHVLQSHDAFHRFARDRKRAMTVQWRDRYLAAIRALIVSLQAEPTRTMTRHGDALLRLMDHEDLVLALLRMCRDRVVTVLPTIRSVARLGLSTGSAAVTPSRADDAPGTAPGDIRAAPMSDAVHGQMAAGVTTTVVETEAQEEQAVAPHSTVPLDNATGERATETPVGTEAAAPSGEANAESEDGTHESESVQQQRREDDTAISTTPGEAAATNCRAANEPAAATATAETEATRLPHTAELATAITEEPRRGSPLRAHPAKPTRVTAEEELSARHAVPQAYPQESKTSSRGATPLIAPLHPQGAQIYRPTSVEAAVQMHLTRLAADRPGRPRTYEKVLSRPSSPMPPDNAPRVHLQRGSSATRDSTGLRSSATPTSATATKTKDDERAKKPAMGLGEVISSAWQSRLAAAREAIARHPFLTLGHTPRESSLASTTNGSTTGGSVNEHASGLYATSASQPLLRVLGPSHTAVARRARSPAIAPSRSNVVPTTNGTDPISKLAEQHSFLERALAPRSTRRARSSSRLSTTSSVTGPTDMPDSVVARRADSPMRKPLSSTYRAVV